MGWVRDRRTGERKPIRVTFLVSPDRDGDLYEILYSLKHGEISQYIRNAIRLSAGKQAETKPEPVVGKPNTQEASRSEGHAPVVCEHRLDVKPEPVAQECREDIERLISLNRLFL